MANAKLACAGRGVVLVLLAAAVQASAAGAASVGASRGVSFVGGPGEVNHVTASSDSQNWVFRDDGPTPITVAAPCVAIPAENAARCPLPADGVQGAAIHLGSGDGSSLRTSGPLTGLHMVVSPIGTNASIDVRDGERDVVWCDVRHTTSVLADASDRVWGGCTTLNGVAWQQDTDSAPDATDLDALDGHIAWIDKAGHLVVRVGGRTSTLAPLGAGRAISRLSLGRDGRGRAIAVFRGCTVKRGCTSWYRLALKGGTLLRLHPPAPSGCPIDSLSAWRATLTIGASCPGQAIVAQRTGNRTRVLMRHKVEFGFQLGTGPTLLNATRVSTRGRVTAVYDTSFDPGAVPGSVWLLETGAHVCHIRLDNAADEMYSAYAPGRPLLIEHTIAWPFFYEGAGGDRSYVNIAPVAPDCTLGTTSYAILQGSATAALPVGNRLFYIGDKQGGLGYAFRGVLRERPLRTSKDAGPYPNAPPSFLFPEESWNQPSYTP